MTPGNAILSAITGTDSIMVPFPFLLDLSLAHLAYQWVKTLGDDDTTTSGLHPRPDSLMMLFENQVAAMRLQYRMKWSTSHELTLCTIQMQVYSFVIRSGQSRAGTPGDGAVVKFNEVRGKITTVLVDLAKHVSTAGPEAYDWPIFSRFHLGRAVAIGIYTAATTSDNLTRLTILQACKDIVKMLAGYVQYPKEHIARVTKHFAAGIRTIEGRGLEWFQTVETSDTRAPIRARMSANIPYQIIWWAKHSSRIVPEPEQAASVPLINVSINPSDQQRSQPTQIDPAHQPLAGLFDDAADLSFHNTFNDLEFDIDFTDIHLDWQWLNEEFIQSEST